MTFDEWWAMEPTVQRVPREFKELARTAWTAALNSGSEIGSCVSGVHYYPAPEHQSPPGAQRP